MANTNNHSVSEAFGMMVTLNFQKESISIFTLSRAFSTNLGVGVELRCVCVGGGSSLVVLQNHDGPRESR